MPSKSNSIDKTDVSRWGGLVIVGAVVGAMNALASQVIPEIASMEGPANAFLVLALTFLIDLGRRYVTDTRVVSKKEMDKLVVKE